MRRVGRIATLAAALTLGAGLAATLAPAQPSGSLGNRDNGLGGRTPPGTSPGTERLQDRLPQRDLPTLQDRSDIGGAPPAVRDDFAAFCKERGCPGGYAQQQGAFMLYQQELTLQRRETQERDALRQLQQRNLNDPGRQ